MQHINTFNDEKIFPCKCTPKIDGIRVEATRINGVWTAYTKSGSDVTPFMTAHFLCIEGAEDCVVDGEMQSERGFKATLSAFKTRRFGNLVWHVFDTDVAIKESDSVKIVKAMHVETKCAAEFVLDMCHCDDICDGVVLEANDGTKYKMKKYHTVSGEIIGFPRTGYATVRLGESDGGQVVNCRAKVRQHRLKLAQRIELSKKVNTWVYLRKI